MILYLDFVSRITSYIQSLILDYVSLLDEVYFQRSPQTPHHLSRHPVYQEQENRLITASNYDGTLIVVLRSMHAISKGYQFFQRNNRFGHFRGITLRYRKNLKYTVDEYDHFLCFFGR